MCTVRVRVRVWGFGLEFNLRQSLPPPNVGEQSQVQEREYVTCDPSPLHPNPTPRTPHPTPYTPNLGESLSSPNVGEQPQVQESEFGCLRQPSCVQKPELEFGI